MKVEIFSKFAALNLIRKNFSDNTAVISFYTPVNDSDRYKVDRYLGVTEIGYNRSSSERYPTEIRFN